LEEATLEAGALSECQRRLPRQLSRVLPLFYRQEPRAHARVVRAGLLGDLERKPCEPIARENGLHRKPIQFFVGAGKWDAATLMHGLRTAVVAKRGAPQGLWIFAGTPFPKQGNAACGVKRPWCGRLGKIEHCPAAVFLA